MDKDRFEAGRMRLWLRQTFFLLIHIKCRTCLSEVNMTNFTSIVIYNTHTTKRSVKIKFELLEISDLQVFLALLVIWFCSGNLTFKSSDLELATTEKKWFQLSTLLSLIPATESSEKLQYMHMCMHIYGKTNDEIAVRKRVPR